MKCDVFQRRNEEEKEKRKKKKIWEGGTPLIYLLPRLKQAKESKVWYQAAVSKFSASFFAKRWPISPVRVDAWLILTVKHQIRNGKRKTGIENWVHRIEQVYIYTK